ARIYSPDMANGRHRGGRDTSARSAAISRVVARRRVRGQQILTDPAVKNSQAVEQQILVNHVYDRPVVRYHAAKTAGGDDLRVASHLTLDSGNKAFDKTDVSVHNAGLH